MQAVREGNWEGTATTHKQCKEMTAIVAAAHASHARRQLQMHCQCTQATCGGSSGYTANAFKPREKVIETALLIYTSNGGSGDYSASTGEPCKEATEMAPLTHTGNAQQ